MEGQKHGSFCYKVVYDTLMSCCDGKKGKKKRRPEAEVMPEPTKPVVTKTVKPALKDVESKAVI